MKNNLSSGLNLLRSTRTDDVAERHNRRRHPRRRNGLCRRKFCVTGVSGNVLRVELVVVIGRRLGVRKCKSRTGHLSYLQVPTLSRYSQRTYVLLPSNIAKITGPLTRQRASRYIQNENARSRSPGVPVVFAIRIPPANWLSGKLQAPQLSS